MTQRVSHPVSTTTTVSRTFTSLRTIAVRATLAAAMGLLPTGCVTHRAYKDLQAQMDAQREQNIALQSELDSLRATLGGLRDDADSRSATAAGAMSENERLRQELERARERLAALESQINNLPLTPLPEEVQDRLAELAAQYPNLVTYDRERGSLRFSSDITFASGSDVVQEAAIPTLRALADILKLPALNDYDTIITGHTDSQPISARNQARFPTNTHLSAARAISVRATLAGMGVPRRQMQVAGWGEERPLVANNPNGNTPQNRRVEIFLRPSVDSTRGASPAGVTTGTATPATIPSLAPVRTPEPSFSK